MKLITCSNCGASKFTIRNQKYICVYCGSTYEKSHTTTISINDDIQKLLQKCRENPLAAKRFANLILDIDPGNNEAKKYLK